MIRVHWNLHRGGYSLSVKTAEGWRVAANVPSVCLRSVAFEVSDRQLATLRNVHRKRKVVAWAVGEGCDVCPDQPTGDATALTFNPWRADRFHRVGDATCTPVEGAAHVHFDSISNPDGSTRPLTRVLA